MSQEINMRSTLSSGEPAGLSRRVALAAILPLLASCANVNFTAPGPLDARISSPLPPSVPLDTPLLLTYYASRDGYGSLYNVDASGHVVALFENRALRAGVTDSFPDRSGPVIRLGTPPGRESFIFVSSLQPLLWLNPTDYIDHTVYPRLRIDRNTLLTRLEAALAGLPPGSGQMRSVDLSVYA